jgi:two-component system chemotaxis response regulator CheY
MPWPRAGPPYLALVALERQLHCNTTMLLNAAMPSAPQPILVVEHDPDLREVLRDALTREGYKVAPIADTITALNLLRTGLRPSLILLDIMLPDMSGWDFCNARRANPVFAAIPLVIVSAQAGAAVWHSYAGMDAVLATPFNLKDLIGVVRRMCSAQTA